MNRLTKQWPVWRVWLGRSLGLGLILLMVWQITQQSDLSAWWINFRQSINQPTHRLYLAAILLLMPINWLLEVAKWRLLLHSSWSVSWLEAGRLVLAGISVSLATPNRIGEYGGRLLLAPPEQTANIIFSSLAGSLCQWIAFWICGWPALVNWWGMMKDWPVAQIGIIGLLVPLLLLGSLLIVPRLISNSGASSWGQKLKWWRWLKRKGSLLRRLKAKEWWLAMLLALLRFWVYATQYLLLLWFFNVSLELWEGLNGIFCIYLIQAGIPLPPGLGVISRSEIALLVWSASMIDPLAVVSATFCLFVINLLLPALLGALLLVRIKNRE